MTTKRTKTADLDIAARLAHLAEEADALRAELPADAVVEVGPALPGHGRTAAAVFYGDGRTLSAFAGPRG